MKKMMMTLLVMTSVAMGIRAQYSFGYSGWGSPMEPGSLAWCWQQQQQINAQRMYMQNMIQYRPQTLPVTILPQVPYNGNFNWTMPTTTNYYVSQAPTQNMPMTESKDNRCTNCLGRGFNPKTLYMGNGNVITTKIRCAFCHGNGTR